MQILLTHAYFLADDPREQIIMKPYVPLGILYISAWLERHHIEHAVLDSTFLTKEEQWQHLLDTRPEVVALYVNLMTRKNVVELIHRIRSASSLSDTRIILGGPEVRNNAAQFLQEGADHLVVGEGEVTFLELIRTLQNNGDLLQVAGIQFRNALGEVISTGEREKIKDLDTLPFPNRDRVDLHQYLNAWKTHHGKNAVSISTMRGCPYTCKWCSRAVYGLSYRRRSPEKVVQEMMHIREHYQPDTLWFVDDVFTISHKWLEAFADAVVQQNVVIPYECITRADRMNLQVIESLKRSGCYRVWIGAESGSQRIIDAMDRRVDVQQVQEMIRLSRAHGLEAGTFIMLGYPGEEEADIVATAQHLIAALPDQYTITTAYPIRGTELFAEVAPSITEEPAWAISSDRDIRFRRTYPESYYPYAVRYVVNSVEYAKTRRPIHKFKALAARSAMWFTRTLS